MREILFRGKTAKGEWVKGFYVCNRCSIGFAKQPVIYENHYIYTKRNECEKWFKTIQEEVIPETVGQFTGLTDKNGKKIFEGDIVNIIYTKATIENCLVVYGDYSIGKDDWGCDVYACGFALKYNDNSGFTGLTSKNKLEVIGNIHDNPELLKEQQQ